MLFFFVKTIWCGEHLAQNNFESEVWVARLCLTLWAWMVACQAPLSMGFSRQEYWSGQPCPSPGDRPHPRIEPSSPALQVNSLPPEPPGRLRITLVVSKYQTVVKGKDGIVKIYQVPHVWTFKAVNMCSHVQSHEWVRESGVHRHVCAASTSGWLCVLPSQHGTENSSTVLSFQAHDIQKQVQKLRWCSWYTFQGTGLED